MHHFTLTLLIAKVLLLLAAIPARPATPQAPPLVALAPPQAPPIVKSKVFKGCNCQVTGVCSCGDSCPCEINAYAAAKAASIAQNRPLVVWVAMRPQGEGVYVQSFPGVTKGIVVGRPDGNGGLDREDLPITATQADILACCAKPKVTVSVSAGSFESGGGCAGGSCGVSSGRGRGLGRRR